MFEGDSADMCSVDGGPSGGSRVRRPGSEDPYRHERKFLLVMLKQACMLNFTLLGSLEVADL